MNNEDDKLKNAYLNSLKLAHQNNCKTIAFPGISTGIYKFPKDRAAKIAISTIKEFLNFNPSLEQAILVSFDTESYQVLKNELETN